MSATPGRGRPTQHKLSTQLRTLADELDLLVRAIDAANEVYQSGGPLHGLIPLGGSVLLDGPAAAAREIERLRQLVARYQVRIV